MREILFRGKKHSNGQWIQGDLSQWLEAVYISVDNADSYAKTSHLVDTETVGQFTGLTDKNGVKIFEGDIVKVDFQQEYIGIKPRPSYIGVVEYRKGAFGIYEKGKGTQYFFQHGLIKTVIGNIHDNPELLEDGGYA